MCMRNQILAASPAAKIWVNKSCFEQSQGPSSRDKFASMGMQYRQVRLLQSILKFAQNFLVIKLARIKGSNRFYFH